MTRQELCEFIEQSGKDIYGFCCHLTQNRTDADDLYQDTFLHAADRLAEIDLSVNPKSYLIGVAVGIWKNQTKKYATRQRIAPIIPMDEESSVNLVKSEAFCPEDIVLSQEIYQLVREETASLSEKYRLPVYMYYTAELPIEQIAAALHIPKGTVKSRLHKARKLIKKGLEEHGYEG